MEVILKYFTDFTPVQLEQLSLLDGLYKEWNEKINVISRKDIDGLYEKHVLHSLSIAAVFEFQPGAAIIDIGTGGGFPGIPLAIFFPEVNFHLVDSIGKKLKVVEAVAEGIGLKNVTIQHGRAEEIKNRRFDYVVSRAVAPLKDLWTWSRPLLRNKAQGTRYKAQETRYKAQETSNNLPGLICLKGGDLAAEIQESGTRPRVVEIAELFSEEFFKEKFLLYVSR
ncbi:MAG TPA: 16S rRNA (guanine(527)-N(7))-methyltransferase RsmG [Chitinophagaceae bacterium]|nr:16S rRNA (guanine(527)-N(7))-methyltransferase RsmG [Chitinophagaceae bacterium]